MIKGIKDYLKHCKDFTDYPKMNIAYFGALHTKFLYDFMDEYFMDEYFERPKWHTNVNPFYPTESKGIVRRVSVLLN